MWSVSVVGFRVVVDDIVRIFWVFLMLMGGEVMNVCEVLCVW